MIQKSDVDDLLARPNRLLTAMLIVDDKAPLTINVIPGPTGLGGLRYGENRDKSRVVMVLSDHVHWVSMTPDGARRLAAALTGVASQIEQEQAK